MTTLHPYNPNYDYQDGFNTEQSRPDFTEVTDAQITESFERIDALVSKTREEISHE